MFMKLMMTNHCSSTDICLCSSKTLLIRQTIMPPGIIILVGLIKYRKISKKLLFGPHRAVSWICLHTSKYLLLCKGLGQGMHQFFTWCWGFKEKGGVIPYSEAGVSKRIGVWVCQLKSGNMIAQRVASWCK